MSAPTAARSQSATPAYVFGMIVSALVAFDVELSWGLADIRHASDAALVGFVLVIAGLFWPVFALCLANLLRRQAWRTAGGVLHVGCMVALMLTGFADPAAPPLLPASTPAILLAVLTGWLVVEVAQLEWVQRQLQALTATPDTPASTTAA